MSARARRALGRRRRRRGDYRRHPAADVAGTGPRPPARRVGAESGRERRPKASRAGRKALPKVSG